MEKIKRLIDLRLHTGILDFKFKKKKKKKEVVDAIQ